MLKSNKKGVSEVIATVLLVAIVIVLLAIIFVWTIGFVKGKAKEAKEDAYCSQLDVAIRQACYEEDITKIVIKNYKDIDIEHDSMIRLEGDKSYVEIPFTPFSVIKGLETEQIELAYDKNIIGNIQKLVFFPKINFEGRLITCQGIENEIQPCQS